MQRLVTPAKFEEASVDVIVIVQVLFIYTSI